MRWLTRATTTRTSPATHLLPFSAPWLMPSSLHQLRKRNSRLLNHVRTVKIGCCSLLTTCFVCVYDDSVCKFRNSVFYLYVLITVHLLLQWRTLEIASQSQKTLSQTVLTTMTTLWQKSVAPSAPDRSCVNSLMSITWFSEYFSSLWTTVSSSVEKVHIVCNSGELSLSLQKCPFESSTVFVNVQKL